MPFPNPFNEIYYKSEPGYRFLEVGEPAFKNDEYWVGIWVYRGADCPQGLTRNHFPHRRKIEGKEIIL